MGYSLSPEGHRERLRRRFAADRASFTDTDLLELLLTYAVPRRDVEGIARTLIQSYGSLQAVLDARAEDLVKVAGVGVGSVVLLQVAQEIVRRTTSAPSVQSPLFDATVLALDLDSVEAPIEFDEEPESAGEDLVDAGSEALGQELHAFVNDEVLHSQRYLPEAFRFENLDDFHGFLCEQLPYNAATTRRRRANYVVRRFFPNGSLDTPLRRFLHESESETGHNIAIFYHILRAEPLAARVAEDLVWPALARGEVTRDELRSFVLQHLPDLSASTQKNAIRSVITTYDRLGIASAERDVLRVQLHTGNLDGFVYILFAEFPNRGIYRFEELENGPMRKWLLWDREWMRRQLYQLRDLGIVAKVSDIDAVRQFTMRFDQNEGLQMYFKGREGSDAVLRESRHETNDGSPV